MDLQSEVDGHLVNYRYSELYEMQERVKMECFEELEEVKYIGSIDLYDVWKRYSKVI